MILRISCLFAVMTFQQACSAEVSISDNNSIAGNLSEWPRTDFTKHSIDLSKIISGGPPKDGIPAIDSPQFITHQQAEKWLNIKEPVVSVVINKKAKAYPLQILMFHEIVNDTLGGVPVSVTFCPLCNAAIVFDRNVGGKVLDFGTTGRLRKSDMVMYDRQTESWWQQFLGEGIVGFYSGTVLKQHHASIVSFGDFRKNYPDSLILSRVTGYSRPYGTNPYRGYDDIDSRPFLFFDSTDDRLPPMERVLGVLHHNKSKVYPLSAIDEKNIIHDKIADFKFVIFSKTGMYSALDQPSIVNSKIISSAIAYNTKIDNKHLTFKIINNKLTDTDSRSEWNIFGEAVAGRYKGEKLSPIDSGVHFAFAWLAFRPKSVVFRNDRK